MTDVKHPVNWDFFISYTQADRAWAEWMAWVLEETGYQVLVQAWDFVPGGNWVQGMQDGVTQASRTIAVLSDDYVKSEYGAAEWQAAWAGDPADGKHKLLVIRVADCARPGLLGQVVSVDLFGLSEAAARDTLCRAVSAAMTGRAKPATPPAFPGAPRAMPREPSFPGALPRVWRRVPARNPNFTGRTKDLADLAAALASGPAATVHAVHGMGGVGKTQLATEFVHAHATDYDLVCWIAAEESASIPDQFAGLAAELGLDPMVDPEVLQTQVHARLREVPGWLLIFDNADTVNDIRPWLPTGPVPPGTPGHVIVTTRRGGFSALGRVLDLDVIGPADALTLLRTRVPGLDEQVGTAIAEELGRLPLALEQAAAYLDRSGMPPRDYLDLLRERAAELLDRGQAADRDDKIASLWDISLRRITRENPAAVVLLDLCAYLAPESIPLDLFTAHPGRLPEPLATAATDPLTFTDAITALVDYSLAKRTPGGLTVHRLLQGAVRGRRTHQAAAEGDSRTTETAADETDTSRLAAVLGLLRVDAPGTIMGAPSAWPRWAVLLPHVLAATSHFSPAQPSPGPASAAWLLDRAATYLQVHGRLTEARPLAERALTISEASYGPNHPTVATRLNNLALILKDLGQPAKARPLAEHALTIGEASYGPNHPTVATRLNNLALILRDLGQPAEARPLAERALTIDEASYGPDHPTVATRLNNLATILQDLGQPAEARSLAERALTITQASYGPDHPIVATSLNNLATILKDLGQPAEAQPLAERALTIDEASYGPDHPIVATSLSNLATILQDLGQPAEAQPLAERALAITQASYGPNHPHIATGLNNLAFILKDLGQPAEAQPLAERALAITQASYGPNHPTVATGLNNLAFILKDLGQPAEAQPLAERALTITQASYGPNHPTVAIRRSNLAAILRDLGPPAHDSGA